MAKKENACLVCGSSVCKGCAFLALISGILFLLQDLGVWAFWNISWYTVGFLIMGIGFLMEFKHK
jgi:hypothetical protein